jgi:uncharacterized protein involved in exopolysaccharide biosynthesis
MSEAQSEMSFKELVGKLKSLLRYLWSKWIWICVLGISGAIIGLIYAWNYKPKYAASLSFILSTGTDQTSGLLGLASQFGFNMVSSGSNTFSSDNIVSLMTSRNIVQQALLKTIPEKNQTLVNTFCQDLKLDEGWNKLERTKGAFPFPSDSARFSFAQDSLIR